MTLRRDLVGAPGTDTGALITTGRTLVAVRDWTFLLGPGLMPGINALLLGYLMYRSGLVPRLIPVLGLIGAPLLIASAIASILPQRPPRHGLGGGRDSPDLLVGAVAWPVAGRQGLQAVPHHRWYGRADGCGVAVERTGAYPWPCIYAG